ncbi:MAG: hypothetical protein AB1374_11975, partial [Bacillota bacterium]
QRLKESGLALRFDESVLDWLLTFKCRNRREWERLIDEEICTQLAGHLANAGPDRAETLVVKHDGGSVVIECGPREEARAQ